MIWRWLTETDLGCIPVTRDMLKAEQWTREQHGWDTDIAQAKAREAERKAERDAFWLRNLSEGETR